MKRALCWILLALAISSCAKPAESVTPTAATVATAATASTPGAQAFPSLPAITPTSGASPTPFTPFTVKPAVDNLKVRMNPGYLFDALMMVHQSDTVTVEGKSPGGEWIYIKTADGVEGWVFAQLLKSDVDLKQVPVREPKDVVVIKGQVLDIAGLPIAGVEFSLSQGAQADNNNTVSTDASGQFYAFLPGTASGTWTIAYSATGCPSNAWSDSSCSAYKAGYTGGVLPLSQDVTLPQTGQLVFTWK